MPWPFWAQSSRLRTSFGTFGAHVRELNRCSSELWLLLGRAHHVIVGLARVTYEVLVLSSIPITVQDVCA